ncbi:MAG TPA: hypothetical protein VJT73_19875 [Polyangiaceae bacterium]|nr:hypothetical protein [Polyangiaceae bacterium]
MTERKNVATAHALSGNGGASQRSKSAEEIEREREDAEDLTDARARADDGPAIPWEDVKKELGI